MTISKKDKKLFKLISSEINKNKNRDQIIMYCSKKFLENFNELVLKELEDENVNKDEN